MKESEADRLRRELWQVNAERLRLRAELEEMRGYGLGTALDLIRAARSVIDRLTRGRVPATRARPGSAQRLAPRLSGRELAALARNRLRGPRQEAAVPVHGEEWLTPVLVDYFARDGSTAMMARLAASSEVVVDDQYPFERRYFTYLWSWAQLLERTEWSAALWDKEDVISIGQTARNPLLGPPPWYPRSLLDTEGSGAQIAAESFEFAWRRLSQLAAGTGTTSPAPRYYAEKHSNSWQLDDSVPEHRLIVMLRDPRDVQASIEAFERARPGNDFAGEFVRAEIDRLPSIIGRHRRRLRWIASLLEHDSALVVPFEEMVGDPGATDVRVARFLGIATPSRSAAEAKLPETHATASGSANGRWRDDLDPATAERFTSELAPELRALGFE